MQEPLSYRHRTITEDDLAFIRKLIADHPSLSRWKLSKKLCEAWNWVQANGAMRDMACRSMMLMLHRRGLIALPEVRRVQRNPMVDRKQKVPISVAQEPLQTSFGDLGAVSFVSSISFAPHRVELADEVNKDGNLFHADLPVGHNGL